MVELEANLKWDNVDEQWVERRDGWIRDCELVEDLEQIAKLLLELECHITSISFETDWNDFRDKWTQALLS